MSYIEEKVAEIVACVPTLPEDDQQAFEKLVRDAILTSYKNGIATAKRPRKKSGK